MSKRIIPLTVVLIVIVALVFVFLNISKQTEKMEEVTYRLKWLANVGFIGDLYADTYGLFLEEKIKVIVRPGGPEHDAIRELQTGQAQFGVASADQVIRARSQGADVVVIAQIYQKNPVQWIYRTEELTVKESTDLLGKRVGITIGDNDETIMRALLNKYNIAESALHLKGVQYSFLPFTNKDVQLFPVYKNTQGVELKNQLQKENEPVDFFDPDKYGIRFVANSIVTTSRMISDHKDVIRSFLKAVLRGWSESLNPNNEDQAIRAMMRFVESSSTDNRESLMAILREQIAVTRELVLPSDTETFVGAIDVEGWKLTEEIMFQQKLIKERVNITSYLESGILNEIAKR